MFMDVVTADPEQIQTLEAAASELEEKSDYYLAQMEAREEDISNLKDELERNEDCLAAMSERVQHVTDELNDAVSNAQSFISKLYRRDGEIRELQAKVAETETVIEDLRSDLQYSTENVNSHKHEIRRLGRQLQAKNIEVKKTRSSAAHTLAQLKEQKKTVHWLQAKLNQKDEGWRAENELCRFTILVLHFLFFILEVLVLFLWVFDFGDEESARHTVLNLLTALVFFNGLLLDCNPALKALTAAWLVMFVSDFVAKI